MPFSLNDYSSLEKAGPAGEPGRVYSAIQRSQNRTVAIKKIPLRNPVDFTLITMLKQDILSSGALDHPHIIRIYNFGEDSGSFYMAMEYVNGYSLDDILFWRPFSRETTLIIILHALRGIWFAHKKNIAHCNLKPANILVSNAGKVVVTDFGISNSLIHAFDHTTLKNTTRSFSAYMPPEQVAYTREQLMRLMQASEDIPVFSDQAPAGDVYNHDFDFKKDIWSIGAILYRVLTDGLAPGEGNQTGREPSTLHEKEPAIATMLPLLPADLVAAIHSCLLHDPGKRADSLEPLILALQNFLNDFGLQKSANEIQQYLADKTAFTAETEKKATEYHIRKGKEFLAQDKIEKSNAHFDAAKAIVFNPLKNDQPIVLFPGEARENPDDRNTGTPLAESLAHQVAAVKKVIGTKMFLKGVGLLAMLLAGIIAILFMVQTIKRAGPKNEAFIADMPVKTPPETAPENSTSRPGRSFPVNRSLSPPQSPQPAATGSDSPHSETTIPATGLPAADTGLIDPLPLEKVNDSTQWGLSAFGSLIVSVEPPSAYIFIDKAGVPTIELTVGKYLRAGPHFISALADGYQPYKSEFIITKDSVVRLSIVLKKAAAGNGSLHVYSNPSAQLYIDGSFRDSAPTLNRITLREGDHTLQLLRKGYKMHLETISIAAGEEKRLQINLEKE